MKTYIVQCRIVGTRRLASLGSFRAKSAPHAIARAARIAALAEFDACEFIATLQGETQ